MGLAECLKEIEDTWMQAINEERDLTIEEINHIMKLQTEEIKRQIRYDDGLTDEELEYEHISNNYFKDRDKTRHESN